MAKSWWTTPLGTTKEEREQMGKQEEMTKEIKEEVKQRDAELTARVPQYKPSWNKNGVIQYKDEYCAILQRAFGRQVEFIIAFSDLSKEGYTLIAIDEGKTSGGDSGLNITGGVNSYYYFQKMQYVKQKKVG